MKHVKLITDSAGDINKDLAVIHRCRWHSVGSSCDDEELDQELLRAMKESTVAEPPALHRGIFSGNIPARTVSLWYHLFPTQRFVRQCRVVRRDKEKEAHRFSCL